MNWKWICKKHPNCIASNTKRLLAQKMFFPKLLVVTLQKSKKFVTNHSSKFWIQNKNEIINPIWTMMPFSPFDYVNGMRLNIIWMVIFWQMTCHESYKLFKISTTHFDFFLAFEPLNNNYHKKTNNHIFKMKDDCYKYFTREILIIQMLNIFFHTWTYMNFKGKINKFFLLEPI
jgi:hypothetical protein